MVIKAEKLRHDLLETEHFIKSLCSRVWFRVLMRVPVWVWIPLIIVFDNMKTAFIQIKMDIAFLKIWCHERPHSSAR